MIIDELVRNKINHKAHSAAGPQPNPKHQIPNPKQIQMIKIQKSKQVITPSQPSPLEGEGEGGGENSLQNFETLQNSNAEDAEPCALCGEEF